MTQKLNIRPLNWLEQLADVLMFPLMICLSGALERPQQTHSWNNKKLKCNEINHLDNGMMVRYTGIKSTRNRKILGIPIFHIPILGGWRNYVVLAPSEDCKEGWYVGWISNDIIGISRIKLAKNVRLLQGPGDVTFFGISASGDQVAIRHIASGQIGDHGPHRKTPLL